MIINLDKILFSNFLFLMIIVFSINIYPSNAQSINTISDTYLDVVISIIDIKVIKSTSDLISVTGAVQNNSTENIDHININVTLYDSNDGTKTEISRFISGPFTIYQPGSIERFSFIINSGKYDSYAAEAYADIVK
ncbi:MAG: hypothetical protein R2685_01165 [Candidatus Nitrosocosmicus sp.]|nr:hypothetical protein [Candidatus Nitrosocosmicus sp.]